MNVLTTDTQLRIREGETGRWTDRQTDWPTPKVCFEYQPSLYRSVNFQ